MKVDIMIVIESMSVPRAINVIAQHTWSTSRPERSGRARTPGHALLPVRVTVCLNPRMAITGADYSFSLEPISKLFQQHRDGSQLDETQEIGRMKFPTHQHSPLPLQPGEEALDQPTPLIASQSALVLGLRFDAI